MLKDTWPQYLLLRLVIFALQWLGPGCFALTAWRLHAVYTHDERWIWTPTSTWLAAEAAFYLFMLTYRLHLQRAANHPPLRCREQRRALFAKVRSEIHDPEKFLAGWFRGAKVEDIGREELRSFLDWAFWDGRAKLGPGGEDEEEMEEYFGKVERMMRVPFAEGKGKARALRLTIDPVEMECRTLAWYGVMMLADTVTHSIMLRNGFEYFKTAGSSLGVFPPRPLAVGGGGRRSPAGRLSFWLKRHTSRTRLPVVYVHGIGVGLINQVGFLRELDEKLNGDAALREKDGEVGILVLEILQVSSRLTGPILRREEFLEEFTNVVDHAGFERFVVASHSYGSVLHTHILNHAPLADRISASLLIDPVTILLHMPDVAYNFTVRPPRHANEWQLWYFASKDPGVAWTLGRHFFWHENLLWRSHLTSLVRSGMKVTASLASHDLIVDTEPVGAYLSENKIPDVEFEVDEKGKEKMELQAHGLGKGDGDRWKSKAWEGKGLEVVWWEGLDHAQVFDGKETRGRLVDVLADYAWDR